MPILVSGILNDDLPEGFGRISCQANRGGFTVIGMNWVAAEEFFEPVGFL